MLVGADSPLARELLGDVAKVLSKRRTTTMDKKYATDPIAWCVDKMGISERTLVWSKNPGYATHQWDGTPDPIAHIFTSLVASKDVGVESATGTGKTFSGALAALWWLACFEMAQVVTTAPKAEQLEVNLWKEINRLWPRFAAEYPDAEIGQLRIRMRPKRDDWGARGFGCAVRAGEESATKAQGFHAEHLLILLEEVPGIDPAVMTAFENTVTGPHNLRVAYGNPDNVLDTLHGFCTSAGVEHIRISALDHPNVVCQDPSIVPGAVSQKAIDRRLVKYGEDSPLYQSRVRGVCPEEASNALVKVKWCRDAIARAEDPEFRAKESKEAGAMGVDVANSYAGDRAAIAKGVGAWCQELRAFPCPNANVLGNDVVREAAASDIGAHRIGVDIVGVGVGTYNEMVRIGYAPQALNGGATPPPSETPEEKYANLRSYMWWQLREDLRTGVIALPDDERLVEDLTAPTWSPEGGKITVESKDKIRKRIGRSTDRGDAVVYWNHVRRSTSYTTMAGAMID
jgi:phage terminase large subunit